MQVCTPSPPRLTVLGRPLAKRWLGSRRPIPCQTSSARRQCSATLDKVVPLPPVCWPVRPQVGGVPRARSALVSHALVARCMRAARRPALVKSPRAWRPCRRAAEVSTCFQHSWCLSGRLAELSDSFVVPATGRAHACADPRPKFRGARGLAGGARGRPKHRLSQRVARRPRAGHQRPTQTPDFCGVTRGQGAQADPIPMPPVCWPVRPQVGGVPRARSALGSHALVARCVRAAHRPAQHISTLLSTQRHTVSCAQPAGSRRYSRRTGPVEPSGHSSFLPLRRILSTARTSRGGRRHP